MVNINEIQPYFHNVKNHDSENVKHIVNSIREFGFRQPIAIDADGVIVCGHGRHLAALELKMKEVPCVRITDLDDEHLRAYRLADNKTNESAWIEDLLFEELEAIDLDMSDFGFDMQEPFFDEYMKNDIKDKDKENGNQIQCPHCGMWFDIKKEKK